MSKHLSEEEANELSESARVYSFGSYRMGVNGPNADLDTVCVVPNKISREDFFASMAERLRSRNDVKEFSAVPDAFAPVIKMEIRGIDVDMLFCQLAATVIPSNLDLFDDAILNGLDEKSARAINGVRVADNVLRFVPNADNFRNALRFLKYWATQRGIYGNALGFLAGVTLAILVARVCQLYPNALPVTLVSKFFLFYHKYWKWPAPIELCKTQYGGLMHELVWNPNHFLSKRDLMPIITPCYPAQNSTYNISLSTKRLILGTSSPSSSPSSSPFSSPSSSPPPLPSPLLPPLPPPPLPPPLPPLLPPHPLRFGVLSFVVGFSDACLCLIDR